jgi:mono/diheme cytochrome c family protein
VKARWTCLTVVLFALALVAGCNNEYPADLEYSFSPYPSLNAKNEKELFTLGASTRSAADLAAELKPFFGTPRAPLVQLGEADAAVLDDLQLHPEQLAAGSVLYRKFCLHCHGLVGDGNGSTAGPIAAPFLNPRPRDFRQGKYKFRSTATKSSDGKVDTAYTTLPSREDIARTIRQGVPTANMPSFNLLTSEEIDRLVSYVIHLNLRGRVERRYASDFDVELEQLVTSEAKKFQREAKLAYFPPTPPKPWHDLREDRNRGREIYLGDTAACLQCHGKDGRSSPVELPTNLTRKNDWGDKNAPRDLTLGAYRGGSTPVDIFYRIKLGIAGSGMPAATDKLTDAELWQLVDYVMSLPQHK